MHTLPLLHSTFKSANYRQDNTTGKVEVFHRYVIDKFIKVCDTTGSIARQPGSGRTSKVTAEIKVVEVQMRLDDEMTVHQLHQLLTEKGHSISLCSLGWTFRSSAYCQLIQNENKAERLAWAREHKDSTLYCTDGEPL